MQHLAIPSESIAADQDGLCRLVLDEVDSEGMNIKQKRGIHEKLQRPDDLDDVPST